jgi:ABC-2 type transport system permease protein
MSFSRIAALAVRIVLQFRRDRRTLGLMVVVPIIVLALMSYLVGLGASGITVGLVQEDDSAPTQTLVNTLSAMDVFDVQELGADEADRLINEGELEAIIVIPMNFTQERLLSGAWNLDIIVEGSQPRTQPMLMQGLSQAFLHATQTQGGSFTPTVSYLHGGPEFEPIDYFAPTMVALFAFIFVYLLTAIGFLRERTLGTWERLLASPLTKAEMVLGYMAGFSVFALIQSTVILLFTLYVIGIHYQGNVLIVFVIVAIMTIGSVNLGIFLSTYARNELQVVQFMPMVIVPQALIGGVFWPIEQMHVVFQWIAHLLPITYANFALQEVMIKGNGILHAGVAANIGALLLFAGLMVLLAAVGLRRASA